MENSCSLSGLGQSSCGESRGVTSNISILECNGDIETHLRSCHLSRLKITEYELILARAGHFNLNPGQIAKMTVCPRHRDNLGRYFRPLRSCQYPVHNGPVRKCGGRDVVNITMAEDCLKLYGVLIHVGSRKYHVFRLILIFKNSICHARYNSIQLLLSVTNILL